MKKFTSIESHTEKIRKVFCICRRGIHPMGKRTDVSYTSGANVDVTPFIDLTQKGHTADKSSSQWKMGEDEGDRVALPLFSA